MACSGIGQFGRVRYGRYAFIRGGDLIHAMKARAQFLDELVQLAGGYPSWPGDGQRIL